MAKTAKNSVSNHQVASKKKASKARKTKQIIQPKLIVAKQCNNRWYVYFKGVLPKDNVGCGCKTAKSALRYMQLLKHRYGAIITSNIYERLKYEASKEA